MTPSSDPAALPPVEAEATTAAPPPAATVFSFGGPTAATAAPAAEAFETGGGAPFSFTALAVPAESASLGSPPAGAGQTLSGGGGDKGGKRDLTMAFSFGGGAAAGGQVIPPPDHIYSALPASTLIVVLPTSPHRLMALLWFKQLTIRRSVPSPQVRLAPLLVRPPLLGVSSKVLCRPG
jgi:hypothetical protein